MLNYESTKRHYPPGQFKPDGVKSKGALSWSVWHLPYIEAQKIFDRIDFSQDIRKSPNNMADLSGPVNQVIPTYICPSTSRLQTYRGPDHRITGIGAVELGDGMGCMDYMGNKGPGEDIINAATGAPYGRTMDSFKKIYPGILLDIESGFDNNPNCFYGTRECSADVIRVREITDGLSHTAIVVESSGKGAEEDLTPLGEPNKLRTDELSGAWASEKNISAIEVDVDHPIGGEAYSAINPPEKNTFFPGGIFLRPSRGYSHCDVRRFRAFHGRRHALQRVLRHLQS